VTTRYFQPAKRDQAFVKALFSGFDGTGKTQAAYAVAKGIIKHFYTDEKPIFMADTEKGSAFLVKDAQDLGLKLLVCKVRVFGDLIKMIGEAEEHGAVLIIDSLSHFWADLRRARRAANGGAPLAASDWDEIGAMWSEFSDRFVNSSCHIIATARAGWEYDEVLDAGGNKSSAKMGEKIKAQSEFGFEPSLRVEMAREPRAAGRARGRKRVVRGGLWTYAAYVMKDRSGTINGKRFEDPTFEQFLPAVEALNLGGEHKGVETDASSARIFTRAGAEDVRL
jgi:DNA polymerase III delta prime subunit